MAAGCLGSMAAVTADFGVELAGRVAPVETAVIALESDYFALITAGLAIMGC